MLETVEDLHIIITFVLYAMYAVQLEFGRLEECKLDLIT